MKKIRLAALGVLAAGAALGAFAGVTLGNQDSKAVVRSAIHRTTVPVHPVHGGRGASAAATVQASGSRERIGYFETDAFSVGPGTTSPSRVVCPKKWKVLNAYFGEDSNTVVVTYTAISPGSPRKWDIDLTNESTVDPADVFLGLVCEKGIPV